MAIEYHGPGFLANDVKKEMDDLAQDVISKLFQNGADDAFVCFTYPNPDAPTRDRSHYIVTRWYSKRNDSQSFFRTIVKWFKEQLGIK